MPARARRRMTCSAICSAAVRPPTVGRAPSGTRGGNHEHHPARQCWGGRYSMKLAFEREHLAELRALGLLPQEVESPQRALPALAELLLPPVAMDDRRHVLQHLHAALSTAETLVEKTAAAPCSDDRPVGEGG